MDMDGLANPCRFTVLFQAKSPDRAASDQTGEAAAQQAIDSDIASLHFGCMIRVHGTCVSINGNGVLMRGPSGSGKSDLALRLIDGGGLLVADDQVEIDRRDGCLWAAPPATLAGLLEVRGVGILQLCHCAPARVVLLVDLVAADKVERLPAPANEEVLGVALPGIALDPWEVSAAAKVRLAVQTVTRTIMLLP
jgi:serine kinase of HPr protein (carbohydrate metabolism regulator)